MQIIEQINNIIWGAPTLLLMLSAGALFSIGTGFFQLRHIWHWLKCTIFSRAGQKNSGSGTISQFQAMSSALAATLGTGNIAGVSAALAAGGAGAVLWMWISALLGTMTGFAENVLGIYYRRRTAGGSWQGGAMCYISGGLSQIGFAKRLAKPLAAIFAALCVLSAFGMGNMAQINSAADVLQSSFGIPPFISGIALCIPTILIIFGGIKRVGGITSKLVPFMSGFYIIGALWIAVKYAGQLPAVLGSVIEGAFGIDAVSGGISGYIIKQAISMGFRRGVFSNEAGLGTSVAAHASSDVAEPCIQGMWSIFEVFFDTIIMCSLTAVVLLASPCTAPTAEEAFSRISLEPQYFRLTESAQIITGGAPLLKAGAGAQTDFRTIYGTGFTVEITQSGQTFSNMMTVTGVQKLSDSGEPIFLDSGKTVPLISEVVISEVTGAQLSTYAFSQTFGSAAGKLLAIAVLLFAFSTVIGWSCFGADAAVYLFGERARKPFCAVFAALTIPGAVMDFSAVWGLCDMFNGLMSLPNLAALFLLSPRVFEITRNYCRRTFRQEKIPPLLSNWKQ